MKLPKKGYAFQATAVICLVGGALNAIAGNFWISVAMLVCCAVSFGFALGYLYIHRR